MLFAGAGFRFIDEHRYAPTNTTALLYAITPLLYHFAHLAADPKSRQPVILIFISFTK